MSEHPISKQVATRFLHELKTGDIIKDRFIIEYELGRGGMGVVYKVRDLRKEEAKDQDPYIALKILNEEFQDNPDYFIALQRETRKTQELAHPNIITVYDFDKDGELVYMTMEYLVGKPLNVFLLEQAIEPSPLDERWQIIRQITSALAYAHQKNIIHLDLKPSNIYLKEDGTVKILDFGIARIAKNTELHVPPQDISVTIGGLTPPYASCEMLNNQDPGFQDDIYSLSCVVYEILATHHPFNKVQATQACFENMVPNPIEEISKKQYKAIMHGLAFHQEDRVPTVEQFIQELQLNNTEGSSTWKWVSILVSSVIISTILWINKPAPPLPPPKPSRILSAQEKQKVARMLEIAEIHFMVGRYVDPVGTSALDAYKAVLEIDPNNKAALKGINDIAQHYEQQARALWEQDERDLSIEMLNKGLRAAPNNRDLLDFQDTTQSSGFWIIPKIR
jgi:serine/threonine protein kinase